MQDITDKLYEIVEKYKLDDVYPEYKNTIRAKALIHQYVKKCEGKRLLCVSTSTFEVRRFKLDCMGEINADFITVFPVESNRYSFDGFLNFGVLDNVDFKRYDNVLIISFLGEELLKRYFRIRNIKYESIYNYFKMNSVFFEREYYHFFEDKSYGTIVKIPIRRQKSAYSILPFERYCLRQEYKSIQNEEYKALCLKRSFFLAVLEKDFVGLKEIHEDMKRCNCDLSYYHMAYEEILLLIDKIKDCIAKRKSKVVMAFWIDAISYSEMKEWKYIRDFENQGIWFSNMHTNTPYTTQTMKAILCEKLPIDHNSMDIKNINVKNSPLISSLESRGFTFKSIDGSFLTLDEEHRTNEICEMYNAFSARVWEMLRMMCMDDKKQFFLVHELMETHNPYSSYLIEDEEMDREVSMKKRGMEAVEKQLKWLDEFTKDCVKIMFSDHGDASHLTTMLHTFFSIQGRNIPMKTIEGLVSLLSFRKIVEMVIDNNDVDELEIAQEELTIQDVPYYNGRAIGDAIDNEDIIDRFIGYRGIIDKDYYYAYFANGSQWLCSRNSGEPKLNPNLLFDMVADAKLVKKYREKIKGEKLPSIGEDSGPYTKYLGRALNDKETVKSNNIKREFIKELISSLPNNGVAIRTGGVHSVTYLGIIMQLGMLDKINWIIDIDKNCICKDFGVPVVTPLEAKNIDINTVLAGHYCFNSLFREEYDDYRKRGIEVIDIYEKMTEAGLRYRKDHNFYDLSLECDTHSLNFPRAEVGI